MKGMFLALALLCATGVYAQSAGAPANASAREAQMMSDLSTLLDLTEAQKPQVQAILHEHHAQMRQMFEQAHASGAEPDFAQMKAQHQQLEQETVQKLTPVLTPAQLAKFQILAKMMHGPHMHFHGGPPAQN
jgi:Spy/CpxP family protein refolding chaperone